MIDIKIEGIESIKSDYDDFLLKTKKATQYGLKALTSELIPTLQKHIVEDVYIAYSPEAYERRYDNPQFGRSLYSEKNMNYDFIYNGGQGVVFNYEPDGKNNHYNGSPYYADGDSIIKTIQEDRYYLWLDNAGIGAKRPFWDNFVNEVASQGDEWFVKGFNENPYGLKAEKDGNITDFENAKKLEPMGEIKF